MQLLEHPLYRASISKVLKSIDLSPLYNKRILITGASGLICSAVIDILLINNEINHTNTYIYAAGRNIKPLELRFGNKQHLKFISYNALEPISFSFKTDYVIHGASNSSPELYVQQPVDTFLSNLFGIYQLLEYSINNAITKLMFISSSEVYGSNSNGTPFTESTTGKIDLTNPRSSYAMGKQAAELLCHSYAQQYKFPIVIVRPGHIYGPTCKLSDHRVSSEFAILAAKHQNITLKSAGTQVRSYCHSLDCANAILTVLLHGKNNETYNISNPNSIITIKEMASILAEAGNVQLLTASASKEETVAFNPMLNASLDSRKLESLGWRGFFQPNDGFSETVSILRDIL